jgi:2-polyprenyl-3-methyl-5-hydroxy-6-metoxy-1,4-benzoquinol methylase
VDRDSPYARIRTADAERRGKLYEEIYDGAAPEPGAGVVDSIRKPTARRRNRLSIYSRIIGTGHGTTLELGCGAGDLTCALADLAQRVNPQWSDLSRDLIDRVEASPDKSPSAASGLRLTRGDPSPAPSNSTPLGSG